MQIFKYHLVNTDEQTLSMPRGAEILAVKNQHESVCVWALVDDKQPRQDRRFRIIGTGRDIPVDLKGMTYLDTVVLRHGVFVAHVYEVIIP